MRFILLTGRGPIQLRLGSPGVVAFISAMALLLGAVGGGLGYLFAEYSLVMDPDARVTALEQRITSQHAQLDELTRVSNDHLQALSVRLGQMQASMIRLDALGQRLTEVAGLEDGEFNFDQPPAQGGPVGTEAVGVDPTEFVQTMDLLSRQLQDREAQFEVLDEMLAGRSMLQEVLPAGRPIRTGWLSSYYGYRNDPFTGQRAWHGGVDYAGVEGSDIIAVAAGVVTWSGPRYGYGNMVEINHGNGYITRYGHNRDLLVEVGEAVRKSQVVARMGMTGRATAPHTHFEVILDDRTVDPLEFIRAAN
jgi:murein DD-endopeptidase MepM/ murein hydrolase activator NlpD